MKTVIGRRFISAFCLALALVFGNAIVSYRSTRTLIENNGWVLHTQQILVELNALLATMTDAETGQRGYLLTNNESFLEPYKSSADKITENIKRIRDLTAENPVQQSRITALKEKSDIRFSTLQKGIDLYRQDGLDVVQQSGLLDKGKSEMDSLRQSVSEMEDEENRLLKIRTDEAQISGRNTILTFLVANLLIFTLFVVVYYFIARYVSERKHSEEALRAANDRLELRVEQRTAELNQLNTELERSNRELQDFAFVASHDLQEPLRKIQTFGDRLRIKQGAQLGEEGQDYLKRMQNAAGRMQTLINDLLTFSRVTTKAQPFAEVSLEKTANEVLEDLETRIQQTGGRVEIGQLPTIECDPLQMRQLLQNLIGNALKFHRRDVPPIVKVSSTIINNDADGKNFSANDFCQISIQDNGIGFDVKYLDRIFTPFQRLHARHEYEGTGMGLAVCRKIAERHGGSITAESIPDQGTTFIVTLPRKHENKGVNKSDES